MKIILVILIIAQIMFLTCCKDDTGTALRSGKLIGRIVTYDEFGLTNNNNNNISVEAMNKQDSSIYNAKTDIYGKFIFDKVKFGTYKFIIKGDNYPTKIISNVNLLMDDRNDYYLAYDLYAKPTTNIHLDSVHSNFSSGYIFGKLKYKAENKGRTQYLVYCISRNSDFSINKNVEETRVSSIVLDTVFKIPFYTNSTSDTLYMTAYITSSYFISYYKADTSAFGICSNTIKIIKSYY